MRTWIGIDPGTSGAIARLVEIPGGQFEATVWDTPILNLDKGRTKRKVINYPALIQIMRETKPADVLIELVGAMPKQGVSSTFSFGVAYGAVQTAAVAAGHRVHYVTPAQWKRSFQIGKDKERARQRALQIFPDMVSMLGRKKDHNRAEALLLAYWLSQTRKPDIGTETFPAPNRRRSVPIQA